MLQLHDVYDPDMINVKIKIVSGSRCGVAATEAKSVQTNWVVLDKRLKQEAKHCVEELQCNLVVMKRSRPKVLSFEFDWIIRDSDRRIYIFPYIMTMILRCL